MYLKNFLLHLHTVNTHRFKVFKLCVRAGIPFRGLVHDLSKYSPAEFFEGVKYYQGIKSPISKCKEINGYSKAWLHHKGKNKHHIEYWYDYTSKIDTPMLPYKYFVELVCDNLAAGMTYQKKNWDNAYQLSYYERTRKKIKINDNLDKLLLEVFTKVKNEGYKSVVKTKVLKDLYCKYNV